MFRKLHIFFVFCCSFLIFSTSIGAQTLEEAKKLYLNGKYSEAIPAFEQVIKATNKKNLPKIADAYLYLGNMRFDSYQFEQAAEDYTQYAEFLKQAKKSTDSITSLIKRSETAARMLSRCEDIQLIDSVVVDKKQFLNAYLLPGESGYLSNENGKVIYENPLRDKRYFSDTRGITGQARNDRTRSLFSEIKLQNQWTDKKALELQSDSLATDDFPFVLPDGLTMYYASTGGNSIGGYDLYVTRYNLNNDTWLTPNQLSMPFNSTANDYLMAIDELDNVGYFATDRFQPEGKVVVYTFIPNEEPAYLEIEDEQALINRAKITSIKASWKPKTNYQPILEQVKKSIRAEQNTPVRDFVFVINDNTVYYQLSDFRSDAAKQDFLQSQKLKTSIENLENELDKLRKDYAKLSINQRNQLKDNILTKEKLLLNLQTQYELTIKNVRKSELK
jgi:TolA-binding protein